MEVGALQQMLSRFRQLQEDLQRQVNSVTVEASAGGGMVTVKMNGQKQVVDVRIEPEIFAGNDQAMLQVLVVDAFNFASCRVCFFLNYEIIIISAAVFVYCLDLAILYSSLYLYSCFLI